MGEPGREMVVFGGASLGAGSSVHFPPKSGKVYSAGFPGPGAYLHAGGNSRTTRDVMENAFGNTHPSLKYSTCAGAAMDKSTHSGYKRAYWTKGLITDRGLMYLPCDDSNKQGPAELNLSGQTFDGAAPAFAPLRQPHLRPKETFGKERRFRAEERLGVIKSGIHDLVLPGPGTYIRPFEKDRRFVDRGMMAPADG